MKLFDITLVVVMCALIVAMLVTASRHGERTNRARCAVILRMAHTSRDSLDVFMDRSTSYCSNYVK